MRSTTTATITSSSRYQQALRSSKQIVKEEMNSQSTLGSKGKKRSEQDPMLGKGSIEGKQTQVSQGKK
jgi:hypothetical protein